MVSYYPFNIFHHHYILIIIHIYYQHNIYNILRCLLLLKSSGTSILLSTIGNFTNIFSFASLLRDSLLRSPVSLSFYNFLISLFIFPYLSSLQLQTIPIIPTISFLWIFSTYHTIFPIYTHHHIILYYPILFKNNPISTYTIPLPYKGSLISYNNNLFYLLLCYRESIMVFVFLYSIWYLPFLFIDLFFRFVHCFCVNIPYSFFIQFFICFYFSIPVLAAAPDSKHPFSRISPANTLILLKNHTQLREILQKNPLFLPQNH